MYCLTFLRKLRAFFIDIFFPPKRVPKISLLIPFSSKDSIRKKNLQWLLQYWRHELPHAEIIIGRSRSKIFCKEEALNDAVRRSSGKILVILDADAYLPGHIIKHCANRILEELDHGHHLWYVPYRNLYRLTEEASSWIINSEPSHPLRFPTPPSPWMVENWGDKSKYGHRYGAMIMMFPRKAYDILGGFDERFKGWGGEDIALLRALDTLYGKHKTTNNDILHLWHPFIGDTHVTRKWAGQTAANSNSELANKYSKASRLPTEMRRLVDEGHESIKK